MKRSLVMALLWMVLLVAWPARFAEARIRVRHDTGSLPCKDTCACAFELTPRMKKWVRRAVPAGAEPEDGLRRLFEMLLRREGLNLKQDSGHTASASEAFHTRRADCAGFAFLFVALAREMGVPTYFVTTEADERTTRFGNIARTERHMAAAYGPLSNPAIIDFGGVAKGTTGDYVFVSDGSAAAIFCSNRGVEKLLDGEIDRSLSWLRRAVRVDPASTVSWLNYGVALRTAGDFDAAERAYVRALILSPDFSAARDNLAYLNYMRMRSASDEETLSRAGQR